MDKEKRTTSARYSAEVRARAARMVREHTGEHGSQRAAIGTIATKIGCTAEMLRGWVRQTERDQGLRTPAASARKGAEVSAAALVIATGRIYGRPAGSAQCPRRQPGHAASAIKWGEQLPQAYCVFSAAVASIASTI